MMPDPTPDAAQAVFEGTSVTANVRVVSGVATAEKASFEFYRINPDGSNEKLPAVEAQKTKQGGKDEYTAKLPTPLVGAAKADNYRLNVRCKLDDKEFLLGQEWVVWRERIDIVCKKKVDKELTQQGGLSLWVT